MTGPSPGLQTASDASFAFDQTGRGVESDHEEPPDSSNDSVLLADDYLDDEEQLRSSALSCITMNVY